MSHPQLVDAFTQHFLAHQSFASITEARRLAASVLGTSVSPGTALAKVVDESVEAAVVRAGQHIVQGTDSIHDNYDRLVKLLQRQPNLSVRSSTSVLQQAYSTPILIAYIASVLAGIDEKTTVYESTAGNSGPFLSTDNGKTTSELDARDIAYFRFVERESSQDLKPSQSAKVMFLPGANTISASLPSQSE